MIELAGNTHCHLSKGVRCTCSHEAFYHYISTCLLFGYTISEQGKISGAYYLYADYVLSHRTNVDLNVYQKEIPEMLVLNVAFYAVLAQGYMHNVQRK